MNLIPRVSGGGATCFLWTCVLTIHLGKTKTGNSQHPTSRQTDHHTDPLDPPLMVDNMQSWTENYDNRGPGTDNTDTDNNSLGVIAYIWSLSCQPGSMEEESSNDSLG